MSTRANVLIKDGCDSLWFYRHSDGYPEGTLPTIAELMRMEIRHNVGQAAGWLVVIGYKEYLEHQPDWRVGSYEPTTGRHGDIEWLYTVDLAKRTIEVTKAGGFFGVCSISNGKDRAVGTLTAFSKRSVGRFLGGLS